MRFESTELLRASPARAFGAVFPVLLCLSVINTAQAWPTSTEAGRHKAWRTTISSTALPGKGCFTAEYPSSLWTRVACGKAPDRPYEPAHGPAVGFGNDYAALVGSSISAAVGSFPAITGLTSENSADVSNQYSLQLNTPYFTSPACQSSPTPGDCSAWQQYI